MMDLLIALAAAASPPAPATAADDPPIVVEGQPLGRDRIVCRRMDGSAESRMGRRRVCLTQREWDEVRDQAVELYLDMPRRNPRQAGRTIPDPRTFSCC